LAVDRRNLLILALNGRTKDRREEAKVFCNAEVGIKRKTTGHVPDARSQRPQLPDHVVSEHARRTRIRHEQRRQNAEQRRFSSAVRPVKANHSPPPTTDGMPASAGTAAEPLTTAPTLHGSG